MDHLLMIMIVSRYTRARKILMEKYDYREWVSTFLCENPSRSYPKERYYDISVMIFILDVNCLTRLC